MPVVKKCTQNVIVFDLHVTAGEKIRHTLDGSGSLTWVLTDQAGAELASGTGAGRKSLDWPSAPPTGSTARHNLGVQFAGAGELKWRIDKLAASGALLATEKDCTYSNASGNDEFFDFVKINLS